MLELRRGEAHVVRCLARPDIARRRRRRPGIEACRVAPDELLLIGGPAELDLAGEAWPWTRADGWAAWTLSGPGALEAFARLSVMPPDRSGFLQGAVAGVPAKVIVGEAERPRCSWPRRSRHHVEERVRASVLATCSQTRLSGLLRRASPAPAERSRGRATTSS